MSERVVKGMIIKDDMRSPIRVVKVDSKGRVKEEGKIISGKNVMVEYSPCEFLPIDVEEVGSADYIPCERTDYVITHMPFLRN